MFFNPAGDLEGRAMIREPATLVITNATRSDSASYRCEVSAQTDLKSFDEILINLVVRGRSIIPASHISSHLHQLLAPEAHH
jgi:junctional adhesion protein 3